MANPQSLNRYAYVLNNPTSFVDPQGLCCATAPPRPDLVYGPDCKLVMRGCTTMDCADQYYGGSLWFGDVTMSKAICIQGGVMGYCGGGVLDSFTSPTGSDEFDAIAQANGMSYTLAGVLQINASGRTSTGTGSAAFDEGAWMQAEAFIDAEAEQGVAVPTTGYGTIMGFNGTQSAAFGTFAESLSPMTGTNFLSQLYATIDAVNRFNANPPPGAGLQMLYAEAQPGAGFTTISIYTLTLPDWPVLSSCP
jgi:hypothetical protein